MRKALLLAVSLPLVLPGCQTWGPTWSELSGARYSTGEIHQYRRPAVIERVDDQGAFAQYPVKMIPGPHRIVLGGPAPRWPGGTELKVFMLDAEPCKRYYINAQFLNNIQPEWTPVIDYVDDIAGCTIVAKQ
jgi:hypothetical protein